MPPTRNKPPTRLNFPALEAPKSEKSPVKPRRKSKSTSDAHSPAKGKKKLITSPPKTRGIHKKDEYIECESCEKGEPFQFLFNCPNCACIFHLTCLGLEQETVDYFMQHPAEFRCPRCIMCQSCGIYIYDANNVQCRSCGRAFHGPCRPTKAPEPVYPYSAWQCDRCTPPSQSPSAKAAMSLHKQERAAEKKSSRMSNGRASSKVIALTTRKGPKRALMRIDEEKSEESVKQSENRPNRQASGTVTIKSEEAATINSMETPKRRGRKPKVEPTAENEAGSKSNTENSDFSLAGKMALQKMNVLNQWVYFGQSIRFKPIYESSYPENIASSPNVYVCEFCFRALSDVVQFRNHLTFCPWQHPPGNEIYRERNVNIWEVEGSIEPTYCRNLCLLAKFFLSSKTLYHEVETFTFYILTEIMEHGCVLAGYFSKEKNPSKNNNLSCLLTLPQHQSKGYGKMLIDLSYRLSMREHKIGSPEHPLSDMGLIAYRSYWRSVIICALRRRRNAHNISIKELSIETAVHSADIVSTLLALERITFRNDGFSIDTDLAFNASLSSFRRRTINDKLLVWEPEFEVTAGNKMNSYATD